MRARTIWAVAASVAFGQAACAVRGAPAVVPTGGSPSSWRYDVVATEDARELRIEAWLPPGSLADLVVRHGAEPFVRDAAVEQEDGWRDIPWRGAALHAPECARGCHLRYRYFLRDAATSFHDNDLANEWGEVLEASPAVWLLHPALAPAGARYRLRVQTQPGESFVTGIFATDDGPPGTYEADAITLGVSPYAAFGRMRVRHVSVVEGATIDLAIAPAQYTASDDDLVTWAAHSARTMARFLGCFPLQRVMLLVVPARGDRVRHGETMGDGGASVVVEVGEEADAAALEGDWVLPHEMAHLAVPSVSRAHHWLEEGLAVYVQPIARARAGELRPEQVWREFAVGMPKGARGERGLDGTPDWARTYWGGATFCLVADLEIRRRTGNRLGLEDALRGVLGQGGSIAQIWDFDRLLEAADAAVGASVLRPLHEEMARSSWNVDLPRLLQDLGVVVEEGEVELVDDAPLAAMRRAITEPLPPNTRDPVACPWAAPGRVAQR
jgi:hypothetical protein